MDNRRNVRRSVVTALELRLFHTADKRGIVRFTYPAGYCDLTTHVKLADPMGLICPCCGQVADELRLHPTDRGLACPACLTRLAGVAKMQRTVKRTPQRPRKAVKA